MEERKNIRQVFLDTETTGKKKEIDRIVEIALVEAIDGVPTGRFFHTLINPEGKAIPEDATKIHGITDADVADKPLFKEVAAEIVDTVGDVFTTTEIEFPEVVVPQLLVNVTV